MSSPAPQLPSSVYSPRRSSLGTFGFHDDSAAATALKMKFQKLDSSGNGMLELTEMTELLPAMIPNDIEVLFRQVDINGSGSVSFSEFIDFLFKPKAEDDEEGHMAESRPSEFTKMKSLMEEESYRERIVECVSFDGAWLYKAVGGDMHAQEGKVYNGFPTFAWTQSARIRRTEPSVRADRQNNAADVAESQASSGFVDKNYHVIFDDDFTQEECPHLSVFYSWSSDRSQVGWFIAESQPPEGQPISNFLLFNPSTLADTPDKCRAMWQTSEGNRDKRLFCEDAGHRVHIYEREVPEEALDDDELWGEMSEDEDADWKQGDYEQEWGEQAGEADINEDGWDSDTWCKQNEHRAAIGEQARNLKENLRKQKLQEVASMNEEVGWNARSWLEGPAQQVGEVTGDLPNPKSGKAKRRNQGRKKVKRVADYVEHAPGFVIRKPVQEDHLAQKEKPKKRPYEEESDCEGEFDFSIYEDGRFIDEDFPPCRHSLGSKMDSVDGWMRLSNITEHPCLFQRIVPESCVSQAFPGNMWFTSACAAAAEYPAWIQSMFGSKVHLSKAGRYNVRLYHPGQKQFVHITIDDFVPTKNGSPAFAGVTSDGEIWMSLVEKAFAKLCSSYAATEWGLNAWAMHYICGGSCTARWSRLGPSRWRRSCTVWNGRAESTLDRGLSEGQVEVGDWRDEDEVWAMLCMSMERCYPVACGIDREEKAAVGLHTQRLYSVVDVREMPTDQDWMLRMVLLRNPYDAGKWEGRWSDHSDAWEENSTVRAALEHEPNVGTTFWMSFTDFLNYFEEIDIVRKSMPTQGCNRHKLRGVKRGLFKRE